MLFFFILSGTPLNIEFTWVFLYRSAPFSYTEKISFGMQLTVHNQPLIHTEAPINSLTVNAPISNLSYQPNLPQ